MSLNLYNTELRKIVPFKSLEPGKVRFYTCGPTVYDYAHIGNFRSYMFEDLLRRHLQARGYDVYHVMNLTDVDDKTIRSSREAGVSLENYTKPYIEAFFEDLDTLRIERAHEYPAATKHIGEMIKLIKTLIDRGYAYPSDDGSVYFSISKFKDYGKLAHLDMEGMQAGARVSQDEYEKENVGDFALWKAWDEADGDVGWDSPWGKGRPGWHIECSAMSMKYLGETFDLHAGGIDLIFPHHEDEIAQSEAATDKPFVKHWSHCAHLIVEGKKMSKSAGNFYTLREVMDKGYTGREIRYELLATHYRQSLNFTFDGLVSARASLNRIDDFLDRLRDVAGDGAAQGDVPSWAGHGVEQFFKALDDDLNISEALAALFEMVRKGNKVMDDDSLSPAEASALLGALAQIDSVLALFEKEASQVPEEIVKLAEDRVKARAEKDWVEADRIRDELNSKGWAVKDMPDGPKLVRI